MATPNWKNDSGVIAARNAADSADADIRVNSIKVTGGTHLAGYIMQSDVNGLASWVLDPALAAAAAAQATANGAVSVNTTQTTDIATAIAAAAAAQSTANTGVTNAAAALAAANAGANVYPTSILILPQQMQSVSGNFPSPTVNTAALLNMVSVITGNGAQVKASLQMAAGHWGLVIGGFKSNISGDVQVFLDGTSIATLAGYNATSIPFVYNYDLGTIAAGLHQIDMKVNGKQPSSGGFNLYCSYISLGII